MLFFNFIRIVTLSYTISLFFIATNDNIFVKLGIIL
ncbi:hypothetical protein Clo1100_0527 [Clostridium sp. BNL1100]|nr:hypothetical protein Clo1100_0527 [Clostridium sp. BNL1100]